MDGVKNTGDQPVFKADQGADRQKTFDSRRPGDRRKQSVFQLVDKKGKLHANQDDKGQKKILDYFAINLNIVIGPVFGRLVKFIHL
jgi:hypothetical protein